MNIEQIRQDTTGCSRTLFLNSAGSSLMPRLVLERMEAYLREEQLLGGYAVAAKNSAEIEEFYEEAARLLNGKAHNIAFAYNATHAYSQALSAIPFRPGDSILTTFHDYASNQIMFLSLEKRFGIRIYRTGNRPDGDLDLAEFEQLLEKHRPVLVAVTHVPSYTGVVQPAEAIGELCQRYGTWFLLDACQSVGQLVVDVAKLRCDFLCATGRKFLRGPRGTGFLYVSDKALAAGLEPLFIDQHGAEWSAPDAYTPRSTARRFELFEQSFASLLGLKEALRYANHIGMENIFARNQVLLQRLRGQLQRVPGLRLLEEGSVLSNIVTFRVEGTALEAHTAALDGANVSYSVARPANALLDFQRKGIDWAVRLSPHYFNTSEEMDTVAAALATLPN